MMPSARPGNDLPRPGRFSDPAPPSPVSAATTTAGVPDVSATVVLIPPAAVPITRAVNGPEGGIPAGSRHGVEKEIQVDDPVTLERGAGRGSGLHRPWLGQVLQQERLVVIREQGKPPVQCRVLKCWKEKDGSRVCQVQPVGGGEVMTILEEAIPAAPTAVAAGRITPKPVGTMPTAAELPRVTTIVRHEGEKMTLLGRVFGVTESRQRVTMTEVPPPLVQAKSSRPAPEATVLLSPDGGSACQGQRHAHGLAAHGRHTGQRTSDRPGHVGQPLPTTGCPAGETRPAEAARGADQRHAADRLHEQGGGAANQRH